MPERRSPLSHRAEIALAGIARLAELPFLGKLVLRGDPTVIGAPVKDATGLTLPVEPCTAAGNGAATVLWTGPDEWWLVAESGGQAELVAELDKGLAGIHHQLVDVTDYYTTIELAGPRTRDMLMKLTTLDLHPRQFGAGAVAGSMFGRSQATLWRMEDSAENGPSFRLFVRWSMADYLWCLIAEAGREYGLPAQEPVAGETWRLER